VGIKATFIAIIVTVNGGSMSRVNDMPCTGPNRAVQTEHYETPPTQQPQQVQTEPTRMPDEKDKNLSQEKKSDIQMTGDIKKSELLATTKTSDPKQANKTESAQQVEKAMEQSRANGGSHRDAVVAGAKADAGHVSLNGNGVNGEDRLREVYTNTGNQLKPFGQKYENGKPILPTEPGKEKASSWCGIWATDVWKRSGVDAKWVPGKGPTDSNGKAYPSVATSGNKDPKLQNVKPGDIIITNDYKKDEPNKIKEGSTNHHAIVTETVYQVPGKSEKIDCPPNPIPENGKLVGFRTMNGNSPSGTETPDSCIRKGYVDLTTEPVQPDGSTRKISGYYPLPEKK
jgi:hypothetical protein